MSKPTPFRISAIVLALWATVESAHAADIERMGDALKALLHTGAGVKAKAVPGSKDGAKLFYVKRGNKIAAAAFVERGIYPPDCTHTWAIGINPASGAVTGIRPIEMKCQHAFPTRAASFLDQFKGMGPRNLPKLQNIETIAKATGSCLLTRDAVKRSIVSFQKMKAKL
jgi:hypothetical protein